MSNPRKAPEKSNFAQRCNLLSQYFKEKGSFGDLGLGMSRQFESKETPETSLPAATTLDLLKNIENSTDQALKQNGAVAPSNAQPKDFLLQLGCFGPQNAIDNIAANRTDVTDLSSTKPEIKEPEALLTKEKKPEATPQMTKQKEPEATAQMTKQKEPEATAQMTIFYAGEVHVLNDFPADKAREIMALASKGCSSISRGSTFTSGGKNLRSSGCSTAPESSSVAMHKKNTTQGPRLQAAGSDLPIARRASLHRFLDKRKDRAAAKAPYQVKPPSEASPDSEERNDIVTAWFGHEDQSSKHFDLNL
ncbi:protein TIFY 10A-like isoform X1 [Carya illinoinensis]|uniref:protein TIFY 10A-like isoform X1 n=1 Tax=Carya illinoinensis TaxID=32201 RepID=UPI001C7250FC|nr:protein TIFY 10A-like isoform X1 [Carya illinoinensis]